MRICSTTSVRKRFILLLIFGCIITGLLWLISQTRQREPSYRGKSLYEWLELYKNHSRNNRLQTEIAISNQDGGHLQKAVIESRQHDNSKIENVSEAVMEIGENGIPYLIAQIGYTPSPASGKISGIYSRFSKRMAPWIEENYRKGNLSIIGFEILGERAASAVPDLLAIASNQTNSRAASLATASLARIGSKAVPSLIVLLTNRCSRCGINAASELYMLGTNAKPAIPTLITCLKNDDSSLREAAAQALGDLLLEPNLAVPALTQCLNDPDWRVRCRAIVALGHYGNQARSALPTLFKSLEDSNETVRHIATNTIHQIH